MDQRRNQGLILLTGATGYVGGRLLRELQAGGAAVRCFTRRPESLLALANLKTEVVKGDVFDKATIESALRGVDTAFYLIHSLGAGEEFESKEYAAAANFAEAARTENVSRIIYLGGLGHGPQLSRHLASRQQVGAILRSSGVQTIEFRASIIIGSGSLSFAMIRALVEKLPVMITPSWVRVQAQPIAIRNVLDYLLAGLEYDGSESRVFEIGGKDRASYQDIMLEYARQRGLRRVIIPVPVLTPGLSSLWLGLVTPVYARVGKKLIEGVRNETVVKDDAAFNLFKVDPLSLEESIRRALFREDRNFAETIWSDAFSSAGETNSYGGERVGQRLVDSRIAEVDAAAEEVFRVVASIGGKRGWFYANWLWRVRGFLDLLVGGVGLRRGRKHPEQLFPGDAVDFWRVEDVDSPRLLRLRAEMKVPGRAWLQFEVIRRSDSSSTLRQTAIFDPVGFGGLLYWYILFPIHRLVFAGMLAGIARAASGSR